MAAPAGESLNAENGPWALRVPRAAMLALAALRLEAGVRLHEAGETLWLRGEHAEAALRRRLAAVPGAEHFEVDAEGLCRPRGRHLPIARLPTGPWRALREQVVPELPTPALPATTASRVALTIVRDGEVAHVAPPNLLRTDLVQLEAFVATAAAVRLRPLRMAVHGDGSVLLHGDPLLPLPGAVWVERHGIAVPVGHRLEPACTVAVAVALLALQPGDLACFTPDGCTIVPAASFVALTRSAVRHSHARLAEHG